MDDDDNDVQWLDHILDRVAGVANDKGWRTEDLLDRMRYRLAIRDEEAAESAELKEDEG